MLKDYRLWMATTILLLLVVCGMTIALFQQHEESAATDAASGPKKITSAETSSDNVIHVQALIDGVSRLAITGNTVQWFHLKWAAPGKHEGKNKPTIINGQEWFPEWPDVGDPENRGSNMVSSKFDKLNPPLPKSAINATIKKLAVRGIARVFQQPIASNHYTLIVEFDDSLQDGSADYDVEIHYPKQ